MGVVPFGKSNDRRKLFESHKGISNVLPDSDNPGPGHYNFGSRSGKITKSRKKPTAAFASTVPQLYNAHQNYRASLPGPSNYKPVDFAAMAKVKHVGAQAFGSHTDRALCGATPSAQSVPGPGHYNISVRGTFEAMANNTTGALVESMSEVETAFGSTAARPCLAPTKASHRVGPGEYGDSHTYSGITRNINKNAAVGAHGIFSTTEHRFKLGHNIDGRKIQSTPGVGQYKIRAPRYGSK